MKIDPRDVVSIPFHDEYTKGRCCKYTVIAEIEEERRLEGAFKHTSEFWDEQDLYDPEDIDIDFFDENGNDPYQGRRLPDGMISPRTILGAAPDNGFAFSNVTIDDILDTDGYVQSTRIQELANIDLEECLEEPEEVADLSNPLGRQYWLGEVGPFRTRTEAVYAQAHAQRTLLG